MRGLGTGLPEHWFMREIVGILLVLGVPDGLAGAARQNLVPWVPREDGRAALLRRRVSVPDDVVAADQDVDALVVQLEIHRVDPGVFLQYLIGKHGTPWLTRRPSGTPTTWNFLNVIFAASSLFLFVTTVWMVWDDYDREWKNYQRSFVQLETEVTRAGYDQAEQDVDRQRLDQLTAQRAEAEGQVAANQESTDELRRQLDDIELELFSVNQEYQFTKSTYDSRRYEFEVRREDDPQGAERQGEEVEELYDRWAELGLEVERLNADRDRVRAEIATVTERVTEIDDQIGEMTAELTRLEGRLADLAPSLNDYILNAPLLDFMAPTLKIQQVYHTRYRRRCELH